MADEQTKLTLHVEFKLEKVDVASGEVVEVIEGSSTTPPKVIFRKEMGNELDKRGA